MERINAVIFDLEGVVVDSTPIWTKADLIFLKSQGVGLDLEEYEQRLKHLLVGLTLPDGVDLMKRKFGFPQDLASLISVRRAIVKSCFGNGVPYIPGFEQFHENISQLYPTVVATSLERAFLTPLDKSLGLSQRFLNIHSTEDIGGISKPNPDIFLHAAAGLGVDPQNCLVIEDAPHGITAARRAGMRCIALTTSFPPERLTEADLIVSSYREIDLTNW